FESTSATTEEANDAEISVAIPDRGRLGVSFFFTDPLSHERFWREAALPAAALEEEGVLRARLPLAPRWWVKLLFRDDRRTGFSRFLTIDPTFHYPIASLRLFCRLAGAAVPG